MTNFIKGRPGLLFLLIIWCGQLAAQKDALHYVAHDEGFSPNLYHALKWRNIGPFRGGRVNAVCGHPSDDQRYYMGSTGGGIWQTDDAGISWKNISDSFLTTGSIGALAIAPSNPQILYAGTGEHAVRGVMTSAGDGIYGSRNGGKTWQHLGLAQSQHIATIQVHPQNSNIIFVAAQGALYGPSQERGVYRSTDGGAHWERILFINESTGASDLVIHPDNPRILYAATWDHQRLPWTMRSGGNGSGIYRSVDGGNNWEKLGKGLPAIMGKTAIDVSPANPDILYANIESARGGVYRSDDGGSSWRRTCADRVTIARAWYYTEIFAHPTEPETVYVLNAPMLKSVDGGKTFTPIKVGHSDQHDLWINPAQPDNMILGNDGGAQITFNGGKSWSSQDNQSTAQFYRVIVDEQFPYHVYGGQQDYNAIAITSQSKRGRIGWKDWHAVAGGESAFVAFDPKNPQRVFGGSYQGNIEVYDQATEESKDIMAYPVVGLGSRPSSMKYRFNWNAPIVTAPQNRSVVYHVANHVFRSTDNGVNWEVISPDLTRNDISKQGPGGTPFTNEAAGGENYNTISYLVASPHAYGTLWVGTDDGLVHLSRDDGKNWTNITPPNLGECLINSIEVSPHVAGTAYLAVTRYKFNDTQPEIWITKNYGAAWQRANKGISPTHFVRAVREDRQSPGLLYAGTEGGLYVSFDQGKYWNHLQLNLPVCPITDLYVTPSDLVAATSGRGFWILDDLSALQQGMGKLGNGHAHLFQPQPTVKLLTGAGSEPPIGEGQNPADGLIIDYYLPQHLGDSSLIQLHIFNQDKSVDCTFSNIDPPHDKYTGGPPKPATLSSHYGLNRFHWNLRGNDLPGVKNLFVFGGYKAGTVPPGEYTIQLISSKDTLTTTAVILADPRLKVTQQDFEQQYALTSELGGMATELHQSVAKMRKARSQIKAIMDRVSGTRQYDTLFLAGRRLVEEMEQWESPLVQIDQKTFQDVINFPNRLNSEMLNLKSRIDTHDPTVTAGAQQRFDDLKAKWESAKKEGHSLLHDRVKAFNDLYRELGVPAVMFDE